MRRLLFLAALALGLASMAQESQAQITNNNFGFGQNPFADYYGYYVPRQQSLAAQLQRGSVASINVNAQDRRASVLAQRASYASQPFQPFDPLAKAGNMFEVRRPLRPPTILLPGQPSVATPSASYYNRTSTYYIGRRTGSPGG